MKYFSKEKGTQNQTETTVMNSLNNDWKCSCTLELQ